MDEFSRHGCQMLDVFVSRGGSSPTFKLYTKPSSIWQPLSLESCHHTSVHVHWPISQCMRIYERFSCPAAGRAAVDSFKRAYQNANGGVNICDRQPKQGLLKSYSWMVLPFDFVVGSLSARIQLALSNFRVPSGAFNGVRVSWSLANQHLVHLLRSATK